jgi:hypothetical protein
MPAARRARRGLSIGAVALLSLWIPLLVNGLEAPRREHEQDGDIPPKPGPGSDDTTGIGETGGSCPNADDVMLSVSQNPSTKFCQSALKSLRCATYIVQNVVG